jgi:hypothetical protein
MKNAFILFIFSVQLYLSSSPLMAQAKPYAELIWKNVQPGDIIGGEGLAIADLNLDGKIEIIATEQIERASYFFTYAYQSGAFGFTPSVFLSENLFSISGIDCQ